MVGSGRVTPSHWLAVAGLLRPCRTIDLCGACGYWDVCPDVGHAPPAPRAIGNPHDAAIVTAAAKEPVRRAAGLVQGALGAARARHRDHLSWLDRRAAVTPHCLCRTARKIRAAQSAMGGGRREARVGNGHAANNMRGVRGTVAWQAKRRAVLLRGMQAARPSKIRQGPNLPHLTLKLLSLPRHTPRPY
jgi:hypothetical protein